MQWSHERYSKINTKFLLGYWHGYYLSKNEDHCLNKSGVISANWQEINWIKIKRRGKYFTTLYLKLRRRVKRNIRNERLYDQSSEHERRALARWSYRYSIGKDQFLSWMYGLLAGHGMSLVRILSLVKDRDHLTKLGRLKTGICF